MIAAKRLRYPLPGSRWNEYQALWPPGFEMPGLDPEPLFKIGPVNGRRERKSGPRRKAEDAPEDVPETKQRVSRPEWDRPKGCDCGRSDSLWVKIHGHFESPASMRIS